MAKQTFTTGSVLQSSQMNNLQANDYNWTVSQKTASYVLVAADAGTRIEMNAAGATTVTVNTGLFTAGDTLFIQNIGGGVTTVTAGTASVQKSSAGSLALSQYQGGYLYFISASNAVFFADAGYTPPLTTKGDLFGFDTTNARIPIGSNNQVLTADSTQALGLKWATPSSSYVGCSVSNSTNITTTTGAYTQITFDTEQWDTDSIHSTSSNTSRFTIPSGKGGKWLISGSSEWASNATGVRSIAWYKNGVLQYFLYFIQPNAAYTYLTQLSYVVNVAAGDYVELYGYQTSGGNLNYTGGTATVQFSYLGA